MSTGRSYRGRHRTPANDDWYWSSYCIPMPGTGRRRDLWVQRRVHFRVRFDD